MRNYNPVIVPPAALLTLEEYKSKVVPALEALKKLNQKYKGMFAKRDYYGIPCFTWDEIVDYIRKTEKDSVQEYRIERLNNIFPEGKKEIPAELITLRDGLLDIVQPYLGEFFDWFENDCYKSNKRIIRWAMEKKLYKAPVESDQLTIERLTEVCNSVGVRVMKSLMDEGRRKELIKGKLNPKVKEVIDNLAVQFKADIKERTIKHYNDQIKKFLAGEYTFDRDNRAFEAHLNRISKLSPSEMDAEATMISEQQAAFFVHKSYDKFGGLLPTKECVKEIDFKGGLYTNTFHIVLMDGTKFTCNNQIVLNFSILGNAYNQFPTTFSYLVLANGTTIGQISETDLKKTLNETYKEK